MSRTALVTGANRGIGRAVAVELVARGLEVWVAGRDEAAVGEAATETGGTGVVLDVRSARSVDEVRARTGPVDVLVNNAALLDEDEDPLAQADERVVELVDTNLLGAWRTCRAYVPAMLDHGWGRVVNVSSGAGALTTGLWPAAPAYSVSKAALNALTIVLADRTRGTNVKVNAVNPGVVGTRMAPYASKRPEEVAGHIADLATLPDDGPTGGFFFEGRPEPW